MNGDPSDGIRMRSRTVGRRPADLDPIFQSNGMPWQVKAVLLIGVPSVIALYLVWSLVHGVIPVLLQGQTTMNQILMAMQSVSQEHVSSRQQTDTMIAILRANCVNNSQTAEARERCLR